VTERGKGWVRVKGRGKERERGTGMVMGWVRG
jgi:hypothetical protein